MAGKVAATVAVRAIRYSHCARLLCSGTRCVSSAIRALRSSCNRPCRSQITPREESTWPNGASRKPTSKVVRKTRSGDLRRPQPKPVPGASASRAAGAASSVSLRPNAANFAALTPVSFLPRSAEIHPERIAVIHGTRRYTYRQFYDRARQLASALARPAFAPATRFRPCSPTCRRWSRRITACRCSAPCSTPSIRGSSRRPIAYILQHGEAKVADHRPRIRRRRSDRLWRS